MTKDDAIKLAMEYGFTGGFDADGNLMHDSEFVEAVLEAVAAERKWMGLTDEDVTWLCNTAKSHEQTWGMFVRMVEAKLKEKNA